ncbi:MAG: hypothetical protein QOJ95_3442, partial [Mycobacterium sp.]|nr:hypothetical protein [Mycobacterium sp.]
MSDRPLRWPRTVLASLGAVLCV